jgi:Flp pilus assembly protein TadG
MMVEMTLITPLMLALSAGVFEFGNLFEKKLLIEAGLRDAARYAARCRPLNDATCIAVAAKIAATASVDGTGTARVSGWAWTDVTVDPDYLTVAIAVDGDGNQNYRSTEANVYAVRVSTSFTYTGTSLLSYLGLSPIILTGAQEERYIGW